jgi:hypothetical protein
MSTKKGEYIRCINTYFNENYRREIFNFGEFCRHTYDMNVYTLLCSFNINFSKESKEDFDIDDLFNAEEENVRQLYKYLFKDKYEESEHLTSYFTDGKYAIEALGEDEFFNLNLYLQECFECNKAERKLATAMLLRSCLEIIIDLKGNLDKNIEKFFTDFDTKEEFKDFADKAQQLKPFFHNIRGIGNDVAHIKKDDMNDVINKINLTDILKLICMLIENSILKPNIEARKAEAKKKKIESIDFNIEEDVPF